jgi:hypothetical protein
MLRPIALLWLKILIIPDIGRPFTSKKKRAFGKM